MKKKIVIRVKSLTGTFIWPTQYYDITDRQTHTMLDTGQVVIGPVSTGIGQAKFTVGSPEIVIEYDDQLQADRDKKALHGFWSHSPHMEIYGGLNPNALTTTRLLLVDENQIKDFKTSLIKDQGDVSDRIRKANKNERMNVAVYYGIPKFSQMDEDEILVALIDWKTGILMNPELMYPPSVGVDPGNPKGISYMKHFLSSYSDSSASVLMEVNIKRAIDDNLIKLVGKIYKFNGEPIGENIDECVNWFTQRPETYDVSIIGGLQSMAIKRNLVKNAGVIDKKKRSTEAEVRNRAHELRIPDWYKIPIPELMILNEKKTAELAGEDPQEELVDSAVGEKTVVPVMHRAPVVLPVKKAPVQTEKKPIPPKKEDKT